jgi:phosphatidylglycerol:prolipoprotein diacylglycerol transferase
MQAPQIDPVIFSLGFLQIRWYSLMYIIGLVAVFQFFKYSLKKKTLRATMLQIDNILAVGMLGMIVGARLVYVTLYNPSQYLANPQDIIAVWKGGLSFHGALIGICVGLWIYCKKAGLSFFNVMDHAAVAAPIGLLFGRIGNFINGELYGRVTDVPWGMVFPSGGPLPRHPSQLYESLTEGLLLLLILNFVRIKNPKTGVISGLFVLLYGVMRFFIEFFREPDSQLGFVLGPFSMGQVLCGIMWIVGAIIMISAQSSGTHFSPKKGEVAAEST